MSVEDDHDAVHSPDNCTHTCRRTWDQVSAFRHRLAFSVSFPEHVHEENQIMWITQGSAMISSAMGSWMVAPGNAIWMPADTVHSMAMAAPAEFHSVYLMPEVGLRESRWAFSHTFEMDDLLAALIGRLELRTLSDVQRGRCVDVLVDVLDESAISSGTVPLPRDERAATVAAAILSDPADRRELRFWADELSISTKTLARAFRSETSLTFSAWRTRARLSASLTLLASGVSVEQAAREVGYLTTSAFIAAFRAQIGINPGAYARRSRAAAAPPME